MKTFNLKIGGIKEMLTKDQMKKITGGYSPCDNRWDGGAQYCTTMGGTHQRCWAQECGEYYVCVTGPAGEC
jgi:hypothetical protein